MNNRLAVSLITVSLMTSGAAFAQSTTAQGAREGARTGGEIGGPIGEVVGGTVGAAVGLGLEIPNAVISSIPERGPSVTVRERVVVGEPLPPTVELRPVARVSEPKGHPDQHKGERMLTVLTQAGVRAVFWGAKGREGDGSGKAPREQSEKGCHRRRIARLRTDVLQMRTGALFG